MPNSKISELKEVTVLHSDYAIQPFPHEPIISPPSSGQEPCFMLAIPNIRNEKIYYKNLNSSLLDKNLLLTGKQLISGHKIFADPCTFLSRTNVHEILDNTLTGDISGNVFVGNSGLLENIGLGKPFHERNEDPSYIFDISGDSCFFGELTHTGNLRQEGDLYRIGDSNLLGNFKTTGDSWRYGNLFMEGNIYLTGNMTQTGNSHLFGDELHVGNLSHTGDTDQEGNLHRVGDTNLLGDFRITGDSWRYGDLKMLGDYTISGDSWRYGDLRMDGDILMTGDFDQTGNKLIYGNKKIDGDLYVEEYIYHLSDQDTFLRFTDDKINLEAGSQTKISLKESEQDQIEFFTSGEEQMRITNEGFLAINNVTPIAELSVTGDSFLEDVFVYDEIAKKFNKVYGGDDEKVTFRTIIQGGQDKYLINLPKTFKEKPILAVSLENLNQNVIVPFVLQSGTTSEYYMQFSNQLPNDEYIVNTTAICSSIMQNKNDLNYDEFPYCSPMDPGAKRHGIQRFYFTPEDDSYSQQIFFPLKYDEPPNISINIEGGEVVVPYVISNITKESFTLRLGGLLTKNHTIHCLSSTQGIHRLGSEPN